jgi:hypothetical protein
LSTNSLYMGERGAEYYAQRRKLRSGVTQQERAAFFLDIADEEAITSDFGCGNGDCSRTCVRRTASGLR